jgi:hypothetical protein
MTIDQIDREIADMRDALRIPFDGAENLPRTINGWNSIDFYGEANQ